MIGVKTPLYKITKKNYTMVVIHKIRDAVSIVGNSTKPSTKR